MNAAFMLRILEKMSLNRLDKNVGWTLSDWEKRYSGVSLYQGIVLCLAPDMRYLAGTGGSGEPLIAGDPDYIPNIEPPVSAGPLAPFVKRVLAPGVYLLSASGKDEIFDALEKAGVSIIAQPKETMKSSGYAPRHPVFPPLANEVFYNPAFVQLNPGADQAPEINLEQSESIKERFRRILKGKHLPKPEFDELTARIERSMIVSESQLESVSVKYEKLEARGLDYTGKVAIAKQAASSGSVVEVFRSHADGSNKKILGVPEKLEKSSGEIVLVLKVLYEKDKTDEAPESEMPVKAEGQEKNPDPSVKIPLGKISLIRRIKQSIFEE
jgi:hypothetical protein